MTVCDDRLLSRRLRVVAAGAGRVALEADRLSACKTCAAKAGCGAGALAEIVGARPLLVPVPDGEALQPGDEVSVTLPAGAFLRAAGLAYLLPPLALVLAACGFTALGLPEATVAGLSLGVLALSFWPLRQVDRNGRLLAGLRIDAEAQKDRVA